MIVLSPHCQFLVAMDPASGQPPLRCTRCDALLAPEHAPAAPPAAQPAIEIGIEPAVEASIAATDAPAPEPASDDDAAGTTRSVVVAQAQAPLPEADADGALPATSDAPDVAPDPAIAAVSGVAPTSPSTPGFVHRQRMRIARAPRNDRWMFVVLAVLSLLLALQLLLADRAALARDPRWRPAMLTLCGALQCCLPPWREPTAFTLLDRDVRPRPGAPGVLRVTATFRNDARWPQPWPALLLTLSDLDGHAAGARVFSPREYLGSPPAQDTLASGQSAMLSMDVVEPGPRIVAFSFDFK
jgi:hypothetical protein